MDNVRLLKRHLKDFIQVKETGSGWSNGEWVEGSLEEISFKAAPFPVDQYTLNLIPQGAVNQDSIKLYTNYIIDNAIDVKIKRNDVVYSVYKNKPFKEIADLYIYILNKEEK